MAIYTKNGYKYIVENPPATKEGLLEGAVLVKARLAITPFEFFCNIIDGDTIKAIQTDTAVILEPNDKGNLDLPERLLIRLLGINSKETRKYMYDDKNKKLTEIFYVNGSSKKLNELDDEEKSLYESSAQYFDLGDKAKLFLLESLGIDISSIKQRPFIDKETLFYGNEFYLLIDRSYLNVEQDEFNPNIIKLNPKGTDVNKRYLGIIYAKIDDKFVNINKSALINDFKTQPYPYTSEVDVKSFSRYYDYSSYVKLYEEHTKNAAIDNKGVTIDNPYDDRIEIMSKLGFDKEFTTNKIFEWTMFIGDVLLVIPPEQISITTRTRSERIETIRSKSSLEKGIGHSERYISMSLYFSGKDMINGYKYETTLPNKQKRTYYMYGLRQLIAQFKKSPIVPVNGYYLNFVHNIEAVCLQSIRISTVPGLVETLKVDIVMSEFEPRAYIHDLSQNERLDMLYNWPLFRYYIQKSFDANNLKENRTYLKPIDKLNGKLKFSLISESYLKEMYQYIKKINLYNAGKYQNVKDAMIDIGYPEEIKTNYEQYKFIIKEYTNFLDFYIKQKDKKLNNIVDKYNLRYKGNFKIINGKPCLPLLIRLPFRYFEYNKDFVLSTDFLAHKSNGASISIFGINIGNQDAFNVTIDGESRDIVMHSEYKGKIKSTENKGGLLWYLSVTFDEIYKNIVVNHVNEKADIQVPYQVYLYVSLNEIPSIHIPDKYKQAHEEISNSIKNPSNKITSVLYKLQSEYFKYQQKEKVVSENIIDSIKDISKKNYIDDSNIEFVDLEIDSIITGISITMSNKFSNLQLLSNSIPTRQYLGGTDTVITLNLAMTSYEEVEKLRTIYDYCSYIVRNYRLIISDGFLKVNNEFVNLAGVYYCVINDVTVDTVPEYPHLFNVTLTLVSFDTTQRNRQELQKIGQSSAQNVKDSSFLSYEEMLKSLKDIEVYPDLELPTIEELKLTGFKLNDSGGKFPDPDFYISYNNKLMLKDVIKESILSCEKLVAIDANTGEKAVINTKKIPSSDNIKLTSSQDYNQFERTIKDLEDKTSQTITNIIKDSKTNVTEPKAKEILPGALGLSMDSLKDTMQYVTLDFFGAKFNFTKPFMSTKESKNLSSNIYKLMNRLKQGGPYLTIVQEGYKINPNMFTYDKAHEYLDKVCDEYNIPKDPVIRGYIHALMDSESGGRHYDRSGNVIKDYAHKDVPYEKCTGVGIMQINLLDGNYDKTRREYIINNPVANIEEGIRILITKYKQTFGFLRHKKDGVILNYGIYTPKELAYKPFFSETLGMYRNDYYFDLQTERARWFYACMLYKGAWLSPNDISIFTIELQKDNPTQNLKQLAEKNTYYKYFANFILSFKGKYSRQIYSESRYASQLYNQDETERLGIEDQFYNYYGSPSIKLSPDDLFKNSLHDTFTFDRRGRLSRAFPTYFILLIDEGRTIYNWKTHDNFYMQNSVVSLDVLRSRKMVASTCTLQLANMFNSYWRWDFENKMERQASFSEVYSSIFNTEEYVLSHQEERNQDVNMAMLKTGARLHVRIGYTANVSNMPILFNGTITEITHGEIVNIIAQGDGIELTHKIPAGINETIVGDEDANIFKRMAVVMAGGTSEPRNVIIDLFNTKGGFFKHLIYNLSGGKFYNYNPLGIVHFGNPEFTQIHKEGEAAQNIFPAMEPIQTSDGTVITLFDDYHSIFRPDEIDFSMFLYNKTPWDVITVCSMLAPDFIASVEPFEFRSTLFFGKPYYPMAYGYDYEGSMTSLKEKRKTFQQMHVFTSTTDIIDNKIKASENGVFTAVVGTFISQKSFQTKGVFKTPIVYADTDIWPEKQKTAIVDTQYYAKGIPLLGLLPFVNNLKTFLVDQNKAIRIATSALSQYMKDMYQGQLTLIGYPAIKPYDMMYIYDMYNDIYGLCEVQQVVHHMSLETGYITTLTPDASVTCHDVIQKSRWASGSTLMIAGVSFAAKALAYAQAVRLFPIVRFAAGTSGFFAKKLLDYANDHKLIAQFLQNAGETTTELLSKFKTIKNSKLYKKVSDTVSNAATKLKTVAKNSKNGIEAAKNASKYIDEAVKASAIGVSIAAILEIVGIYIIDRSIREWLKRYLRNRQAVSMTLLYQAGREISAGINGHKGLVIGDAPSVLDKILKSIFGNSVAAFIFDDAVSEVANITYSPINNNIRLNDPKYALMYSTNYQNEAKEALSLLSAYFSNNMSDYQSSAYIYPQKLQEPSLYKSPPTSIETNLSNLVSLLDNLQFKKLLNSNSGIKIAIDYFKDTYSKNVGTIKSKVPQVNSYKDLIRINSEVLDQFITVMMIAADAARKVRTDCDIVITSLWRPHWETASHHRSGFAVDIQISSKYMKNETIPKDFADSIIKEIAKHDSIYQICFYDVNLQKEVAKINNNIKYTPLADHKNHIHIAFNKVV